MRCHRASNTCADMVPRSGDRPVEIGVVPDRLPTRPFSWLRITPVQQGFYNFSADPSTTGRAYKLSTTDGRWFPIRTLAFPTRSRHYSTTTFRVTLLVGQMQVTRSMLPDSPAVENIQLPLPVDIPCATKEPVEVWMLICTGPLESPVRWTINCPGAVINLNGSFPVISGMPMLIPQLLRSTTLAAPGVGHPSAKSTSFWFVSLPSGQRHRLRVPSVFKSITEVPDPSTWPAKLPP